MAALFISNPRQDEGVARSLAKVLTSEGHQVWWDRRLTGGAEYSREIERELDTSDRVIVLWSKELIGSPWVRDEAAAGQEFREAGAGVARRLCAAARLSSVSDNQPGGVGEVAAPKAPAGAAGLLCDRRRRPAGRRGR